MKEVIVSAFSRKLFIIITCFTLFILNSLSIVNAISILTPNVNITIKDGSNVARSYNVKQDSVKNVLDEVDISLNNDDKINVNINDTVEDNDNIEIIRVNTKIVKTTSSINYKTVYKGKKKWGTTVVKNGKKGTLEKSYQVTYENDEEVSRKYISSKVIKKPVNKVIRRDKIAKGTTFTGRLTTYGADCRGCSGLAASGVKLSAKTGVNNSKSPFLTYKGKKYYCIAADRSIPYGTIIEISNHNLKLPKKIQAIVVDRGGAIKGRTIDIFNGSEKKKKQYFKSNSTNKAKFKIIKLGSGKAKFYKKG